MLTHTLTNAQLGKPYQLLNYIDNRNIEKTIGLKSISYWVGWYKTGENESLTFSSGSYSPGPRLYNSNDVEKIFNDNSFDLTVDMKDGGTDYSTTERRT